MNLKPEYLISKERISVVVKAMGALGFLTPEGMMALAFLD